MKPEQTAPQRRKLTVDETAEYLERHRISTEAVVRISNELSEYIDQGNAVLRELDNLTVENNDATLGRRDELRARLEELAAYQIGPKP